MVATSGSSTNPANPPARIPSVSLVSPTMADAIVGRIADVTANNYSMDVVMRQYLCISKFLLGDKTEVNTLETPYLLAGFDYILAMHKWYLDVAASQGTLTQQQQEAMLKAAASELKLKEAFESLLTKWQLLFRTPHHASLKGILDSWTSIITYPVSARGDDEHGYNFHKHRWETHGGTAPTYADVEQSAFPWPPNQY
jgi:hypothetical protein